jgi:coenzyme F420 biosynthesis associated uncharacterized protein
MARTDGDDGPVELVDWDLAVSTAHRLARPGPDISRADAEQAVVELRDAAHRAEPYVHDYTQLDAEPGSSPVFVIDRRGWVQANADGMRDVMAPLLDKLREVRGLRSGFSTAIGSRVTGLEAGGLLAFLSSKVLGQFDPFHADSGEQGRMLLVAPNIVYVERELKVRPEDFRFWVCLHEETHRVQFTAVPWLREHMLGQIGALVEATDLDPSRMAALIRDGLDRFRRLAGGDKDVSLLDVLQTPEQKEVIQQLTAVMSLLEGHADVVMDGVGLDAVPTVTEIRRKFQARRGGTGPLDTLVRRLLGLDAKLRQYRDGAAFVRGVQDLVGMSGFNAVWSGPGQLPTLPEITDPAQWVRRVHG